MKLSKLIEEYTVHTGRKDSWRDTFEKAFKRAFGAELDASVTKVFSAESARRAADKLRKLYCPMRQQKARTAYMELWKFAFANNIVTNYPAEAAWRTDRNVRKAPKAYTQSEIAALFRTAEEMECWREPKRRAVCAALAILYFTGARGKHALNLKLRDFDEAGRTITIPNTKTLVPQTIHITDDLIFETIKAGIPKNICHPRYGYLIAFKDLGTVLTTLKKHAGLSKNDGRLVHAIRKSTATHIAMRAGVDAAAEHLGHTDKRMTIDAYIDPRQMPIRSHCGVLDTSILLSNRDH